MKGPARAPNTFALIKLNSFSRREEKRGKEEREKEGNGGKKTLQ